MARKLTIGDMCYLLVDDATGLSLSTDASYEICRRTCSPKYFIYTVHGPQMSSVDYVQQTILIADPYYRK
jgi:hypothetical protein